MNFKKHPIALAALALVASAPFAAHAAPTNLAFRQPSAGEMLSGTVNGSDCEITGRGIRRVEFSIRPASGGTYAPLNIDQDARWQCNIDTTRFANGRYTLRAVAFDRDTGGTSRTVTRTVNISNSTSGGGTTPTPPQVSITAPANGATVGTTVNYAANAIDSDGIRQVQFFLDGATTALNTDTSSPYSGSTTLAPGTHRLRAVATDNLGATSSSEVSFTVQSDTSGGGTGTSGAPQVTITSPANGGNIPSGTTVPYVATAADSDGIKKVEFFLDGATTPFRSDTSAPYGGSRTFADGTRRLRAVATDGRGVTNSTEVTFTVGQATTPSPNPGPTVNLTAPGAGATVSGATVSCAADASDSNGVQQVQFFLDGASTAFATDTSAPFTCSFDSTALANGSHTLTARATDTLGASTTSQVLTFAVSNNAPPSVNLTAPASGTVSGTLTYAANASDTDGTINRVEFYLVQGTNRTLIGTDTTNDYGGTYNTTTLANGDYQLMAVAYDNAGAQATTQRAITISNTTDPGTGGGGTGGGGTGGGTASGPTTLSANGARAVPTFESLGMYWRPSSNPGAAGCSMRYRKHSESTWREALAMWYDARNSECRGSIVHLDAGTDYAVEMGVGTSFTAGVNTRTWAEQFPIARTVQVQSGSGTLNITEGGTPEGYVLYTGPAGTTLNANNAAQFNVNISASYVIVRGLALRGAVQDAIRISPSVTNVVIEDNDISGWGRASGQTVNGVVQGVDRDSAIRANCVNTPGSLQRVIIQRNRIHDPRYGANSWDGRQHPLGPNGIEISHCGGNHVIRYNEITGADGHYYKDGMGGQANFSEIGFPAADTDIYGNIVTHAWDDGIEAEGGNRNVRIWGNYIDQTTVGIASTPVSVGPMYIFRNVYNRSQHYVNISSLDADDRMYFSKTGSQTDSGHGRRYVFHNTLLQAAQSGLQFGLGAGGGIHGLSNAPLTNTVSRNNILHIWRSDRASIYTAGGSGNDLNYDLFNGNVNAYAGAEANGIVGVPQYRAGHGWSNWAGGNYQLDSSSRGYDAGARIPNFNDGFTGAAPDIGAHEGDTPAMRLGRGNGGTTTTSGGTTTTSGATTTSAGTSSTGTTTTTTTTSSSGGGLCSSIVECAQ